MIQNLILWNNFLENFVSGTQLSDFLAKSLKAKKIGEKDNTFYNTVLLKNPNSFYESQLT